MLDPGGIELPLVLQQVELLREAREERKRALNEALDWDVVRLAAHAEYLHDWLVYGYGYDPEWMAD